MRLSELFEFLFTYPQLLQESVEEWRTNLPAAVHWNRCGASVGMLPTLMASSLVPSENQACSRPFETPALVR